MMNLKRNFLKKTYEENSKDLECFIKKLKEGIK